MLFNQRINLFVQFFTVFYSDAKISLSSLIFFLQISFGNVWYLNPKHYATEKNDLSSRSRPGKPGDTIYSSIHWADSRTPGRQPVHHSLNKDRQTSTHIQTYGSIRSFQSAWFTLSQCGRTEKKWSERCKLSLLKVQTYLGDAYSQSSQLLTKLKKNLTPITWLKILNGTAYILLYNFLLKQNASRRQHFFGPLTLELCCKVINHSKCT